MCGGFFALLVMRELTAKQAFVSITGGFVAATYCTNLVMHLLSIPHEFAGGVGFAIGVFGLAIIGKVLMIINNLTLEDFKDLTVQWIKAIGNQFVDGVDTGIEVVLDGVEITVVRIGDLGRDVALRDAVDVIGGDIQRPDDRIEGVIDALDDALEVALVLAGIGAGG